MSGPQDARVAPFNDLSGVVVEDRTGDVLLGAAQAVKDVVVDVAYNAWRNMGSTHNAAPCAQAMSKRIMHPRPGDLVYVPDARGRWRSEDDRAKGFGYLVVARLEWADPDEEWAGLRERCGGIARPTSEVFYVQYGPDPADVCRWDNATCLAAPIGDSFLGDVNRGASSIVAAR